MHDSLSFKGFEIQSTMKTIGLNSSADHIVGMARASEMFIGGLALRSFDYFVKTLENEKRLNAKIRYNEVFKYHKRKVCKHGQRTRN